MGIRIWHQSFTVLEHLPAYARAAGTLFQGSAARHAGGDARHASRNVSDELSGIRHPPRLFPVPAWPQFVLGAIAAEEADFDAYAIMSIPEPALQETCSVVDIPVVGYGESAMLTATMLGERTGVLLFIEGMAPVIERNARRVGLAGRFGGARFVGFTFDDVLKGFDEPAGLLDRFYAAAREMISTGVDVIIPGEAPLCALLARNGINRVDEVLIVDALGATIKMAEAMVDLRRTSGLAPARRGYFLEKPPRERVKEAVAMYGMSYLMPGH